MSSLEYIQFNPYEVLGLDEDETHDYNKVKSAFRKKAAEHHPDKGGDRLKFEIAKRSLDILTDPVRTERYHQFGRTDESPVNPDEIKKMVKEMMRQVMSANDDPERENVLVKIILALRGSFGAIQSNMRETSRQLTRSEKVLSRLTATVGADYLGDGLREKITELKAEMRQHEDAMELGKAAEELLRSYKYSVDPAPEGQDNAEPTYHRTTSGGLVVARRY